MSPFIRNLEPDVPRNYVVFEHRGVFCVFNGEEVSLVGIVTTVGSWLESRQEKPV